MLQSCDCSIVAIAFAPHVSLRGQRLGQLGRNDVLGIRSHLRCFSGSSHCRLHLLWVAASVFVAPRFHRRPRRQKLLISTHVRNTLSGAHARVAARHIMALRCDTCVVRCAHVWTSRSALLVGDHGRIVRQHGHAMLCAHVVFVPRCHESLSVAIEVRREAGSAPCRPWRERAGFCIGHLWLRGVAARQSIKVDLDLQCFRTRTR